MKRPEAMQHIAKAGTSISYRYEHLQEVKEQLPEWFGDTELSVYELYSENDNSGVIDAFRNDKSEKLHLLLCIDMLNEVKLLVGACRPEILTVIYEIFFLFLTFFVCHSDRGLFTKRRVCENVINAIPGIGQKRISL